MKIVTYCVLVKEGNVLCFSEDGNCFRAPSVSKMKQLAAEATPCVAESSSVSEFTSDVTSDVTSDFTSEASASEVVVSEVSTLTT